MCFHYYSWASLFMDIVKIAVFVRKFVVNYPININSVDKQNNKIHEIWHSMNTDETTLLT